MTINEKNIGKMILNHYNNYLGDYCERKVYKANLNSPSIQLLKYKNVFENCMTYASIGLSNYKDIINNSCEVIMVVDDNYDECAKLLANSLFYIINNRIEFGRGVFIEGIENLNEDFSVQHKKNTFYFTETYAFPDDFSHISNDEKMYMAFLISQQECQFIKKYGANEFEDQLEKMECDVFDINRKSIFLTN